MKAQSHSQGVLVLFCRSKAAKHFAWFRTGLLDSLQRQFDNRIQMVDIRSSQDLISQLKNPVSNFDISEVHILTEFDTNQFRIGEKQEDSIKAGALAHLKISQALSISGGELLPEAVIKVWYMASNNNPSMEMINEWSDYFNRRLFFLPLAQLKKQLQLTKATRKVVKKTRKVTKKTVKASSSSGFFHKLSTLQIIIFIAILGGVNHFFTRSADINSSDYDQVVSYEDSDYEIDLLASNLRSDDGDVIDHSWVFQRTRWDFSFFVAEEWLDDSERELRAAESNRTNGNEYWASVYRKLINSNDHRLDNVVNALKDHGREMNLDSHDMATFVLSFVQHIPYKIPSNNLELLAPPQTVQEVYGDCDSKSLLYTLIMRKLGYDVAMYVSMAYRHAMAGVSINASGQYKTAHGLRYYFAETTVVGPRIGQLGSNWNSLRNWLLIPL